MSSRPRPCVGVSIGLLSAIGGATVIGAALAPQQTPTFRGGVTLVTVDVSVLDREGKPVPGLTAGDFEIKLDGHVQPVRALSYERIATPAEARALDPSETRPAREVTNAEPGPAPRLFVMMIDDLSISPSRGKVMFFGADRFVAGLAAADVVGFATTSGTSVLNPTLDHDAVRAKLRHTAGEFLDPRELPPDVGVGIDEALQVVDGNGTLEEQIVDRDCFQGRRPTAQQRDQNPCAEEVDRKIRELAGLSRNTTERQVLGLINVINAMRPAPGLKYLVVMSDGLGLSQRMTRLDLQPLARAAAEAGVQVSVLQQEPDGISVADRDSMGAGIRRDDNLALAMGLETLADLTGGHYFRVIGTPDPFFARVAAASAAIYHLGVEAPLGTAIGKDIAVSARVHRAGVTVHVNRQAVGPTPQAPVAIDDQIHAAIAKGQPFYGVPLTVATALRRAASGEQVELGANVEVPAAIAGPLTVAFGLVDEAGTLTTGRKTVGVPAGGTNYRVSLALPVKPGGYRLRFAVADASNRLGSIETRVSAQLSALGPFHASDLLTAWSGDDGATQFLALEEVPSQAVALHARLELYPAATEIPENVLVRFALLDGTRVVLERQEVPARSAERLIAATQFSAEGLAPGSYTLRATVIVDGREVGTQATSIRKIGKG